MVSPAESGSNFGKLGIENCSSDVHCQLPRNSKGLDAGFGAQSFDRNIPNLGNRLLYGGNGLNWYVGCSS
jgi:hypothetical protein